jgi:hypothetical protein
MNQLNLNEGLGYALSPSALRRDGVRIAILVVASFLSVLLGFSHAVQIVLGVLDVLVVGLCLITTTIAAKALRDRRKGAAIALGVYGGLLLATIAALMVLFY